MNGGREIIDPQVEFRSLLPGSRFKLRLSAPETYTANGDGTYSQGFKPMGKMDPARFVFPLYLER